ncbi:MAG: 4Fe-4S dicluster domain-containing protein [Chloroflexi bacterium]|nr:4Fe-4S dicluster domain-containing protein [Chloroflexota bacterium]
MFGTSILKGLWITLRHFFETYTEDVKRLGGWGRTLRPDAASVRQKPEAKGFFTVQYPEEKLAIPERFRYIPMLIYEQDSGDIRCTSCGICAKVCPPQCIWIVQAKDEAGKTIPQPSEFYIDSSVCMSCGYCAEFCPFDAIKMNHDYELASYERHNTWLYDLQDLLVSTSYYAETHPKGWSLEEKARARKAKKKAAVER